METMGRKKPRPRRSFTPGFKAEVVELCQRGHRSIGQVAKDFDLPETGVREWVKQAERDAGTRTDGSTPNSAPAANDIPASGSPGSCTPQDWPGEPRNDGAPPPFPTPPPPRPT
ncbi:transposase [Amycolatopsis sp. NPDC059021]|uniref:transposase n=1 Tax=Amycolatopsis sp. NPDC059021 TaxID=3346704 RepID=UPI00366F6F2B